MTMNIQRERKVTSILENIQYSSISTFTFMFLVNERLVWRGKTVTTQVNRMSRSRRVLAIGGKQRFFGLDMVFIETILFHLESF